MEKKEFKREEVSKLRIWKWTIQDFLGLQIHRFIAWASSDPEVKKLYKEMETCLLQEGDQPQAVKISEQIRAHILVNTQKKASEMKIR